MNNITIKINVKRIDSNNETINKHPILLKIEERLIDSMIYDSNYDINDFLNIEIENQINDIGISECIKAFSDEEFKELFEQASEEFGGYDPQYNALRLFYYEKTYDRLNIVSANAIKELADKIIIEAEIEYNNPIITKIINSQLSAYCTWLASHIKVSDATQIDTLRTAFFIYLNQKLDEMSLVYNLKYKIL